VAANQWKVVFDYGTVRGEAVCATNEREYAASGTPQGTGGEYCWCKATGFAEPNSSNYSPVSYSSWIFWHKVTETGANCARDCSFYCTYSLGNSPQFRTAIYGRSAPGCPYGYYWDWGEYECLEDEIEDEEPEEDEPEDEEP
jgi:hypothetical protein